MASRDVFGVLNGLRRVAAAYYTEVASELQHVVNSYSVKPKNGSSSWNGILDLPEWESFDEDRSQMYSPSSSSTHNSSSAVLADVHVRNTVSDLATPTTSLHTSTGSEHNPDDVSVPDTNPYRNGFDPPSGQPPTQRSYHTAAFVSQHTGFRSFHTSVAYCNETVIGSTSDTVKRRASKNAPPMTAKSQKLNPNARERAVPASRISRMVNFGGLAAGLGVGTAAEMAKRALGLSGERSALGRSPLLTDANIERIVNTLCKVRGAALKLGQMISLTDDTLLPKAVQQVFDRVRNNADFMPTWQMERVLKEELGKEWREGLQEFDSRPLAAASIGQVHRAVMLDGREVAMKIQYPGVAQSINSDIDNLLGVLKLWNIVPEGLFLDSTVAVARKELAWESDYEREAKCGMKFKELLADDPRFVVPSVIPELSTKRVLTAELIHGVPLDHCMALSQDIKNDIASRILNLCLLELFQFRLMQTDPNWSNFYYNEEDNKVYLLDFGATRDYSKKFTDDYVRVIHGAAVGDRDTVIQGSKDLGFLTGYESKVGSMQAAIHPRGLSFLLEDIPFINEAMLIDAHVNAVMILGEPFAVDEPFDFGTQDTTARIQRLIPILLEHRLAPPPEESYSLHRKWAGAFLLCAKLGAKINCYSMFQDVYRQYKF